MNIIMDNVLQLLGEIDEICVNNNIRYIAGGQFADMVKNKKNRDCFQGIVYVHPDDYLPCKEAISMIPCEERTVEIIQHDGYERFRYIKTGTSFFEYSKLGKYEKPGLNIEIMPIIYNANDDKYYFYNANNIYIDFDIDLINDVEKYVYKGRKFRMPKELDQYYNLLYTGLDGKTTVPLYSREDYLVSACVGYESIINSGLDLDGLNREIVELEERISNLTETIDYRNAEMEKVLDQVRELYDISK